mmetsp:Transcript_649/g.598  ORF Transcript_649/g.598 Transcript_649/m.598 type:complete len:149 (+) Transcript_649:847-1293(+)
MGDFFVELFETQWKEHYLKPYKKVEKRDFIFMIIPPVDDPNSGVNLNMRRPVGEFEVAKTEIAVFLIFRKIRYTLIKSSKYDSSVIENYKNQTGESNPSNNWEVGKFYEIDQRKLLPCYLKENNSKIFCYIVEDEENFIVINPDYNKV